MHGLKGGIRWLVRWMGRLASALMVLVLLFVLAMVAGLWPTHQDFRHATDGIEIYVVHKDIHTSLVLPTVTTHRDWRPLIPAEHFPDRQTRSHLKFGWGERRFCLETPKWSELKASAVCQALLVPSEAVMHVSYVDEPDVVPDTVQKIRLSNDQFARLVAFVDASLPRDSEGRLKLISGASYGQTDTFYESTGSYHLLTTCNNWTGQALQHSSVQVGIWTPLPHSVMWSLPAEAPE